MKEFVKKYLTFHYCWWKPFKNHKTFEAEFYTSYIDFTSGVNFLICKDIFSIDIVLFQSLFEFEINVDRKCDHAGVKLCVCLFGFVFRIGLYDNRHWDYDNNCWEE